MVQGHCCPDATCHRQDAEGKQKEKAERLRFGRFFYRFPNGESGADVYDRMTIFEVRPCLPQGCAARSPGGNQVTSAHRGPAEGRIAACTAGKGGMAILTHASMVCLPADNSS